MEFRLFYTLHILDKTVIVIIVHLLTEKDFRCVSVALHTVTSVAKWQILQLSMHNKHPEDLIKILSNKDLVFKTIKANKKAT